MIYLNRLNGKEFVINSDLIEHIESTPDTVIAMTDGKKLVVQQSPAEIIERIIAYRRRIFPYVLENGENAEKRD